MDARGAEREVRGTGLALVLVGALAVLVSFGFLDWYRGAPGTPDSAGAVTFSALHASADQLGGAGVAIAYFGWLAWALLIASIAVGVAAGMPTRVADPLRVLGFLVGIAGAVATYYALAQHFDATGSTDNVFHNSTWGVWAAMAGFLAAAIGAVLGPRRRGRR